MRKPFFETQAEFEYRLDEIERKVGDDSSEMKHAREAVEELLSHIEVQG